MTAGNALRLLVGGLFASLLVACAGDRSREITNQETPREEWSASASIEEYILALPAYEFHEETVESFSVSVRHARRLPENRGKSPDYLFVPGDGTWPAKEFFLDRATGRLTIKVHPGPEPGSKGYTTVRRRVAGGWILEK